MEVGQIAIKFRVKKENGWIEDNLPKHAIITRSSKVADMIYISERASTVNDSGEM
jgi:hypothetical protein